MTLAWGSIDVPAAGFSALAVRMADDAKVRRYSQKRHVSGRLEKPTKASSRRREAIPEDFVFLARDFRSSKISRLSPRARSEVETLAPVVRGRAAAKLGIGRSQPQIRLSAGPLSRNPDLSLRLTTYIPWKPSSCLWESAQDVYLFSSSFVSHLICTSLDQLPVKMFIQHGSRALRKQWHVTKGMGQMALGRRPSAINQPRWFMESRRLLAVKPVLLADIGEGKPQVDPHGTT